MKYVIGRKVEMTQLFDEKGVVTPVTIVDVAPNTVTNIKTTTTHGYDAVQVASIPQKKERVSQAELGNFGGVAYKLVREFRTDANPQKNIGDAITVAEFAPGDMVTVTGTSKAKGFQGVVKRHGFAGGPRTHGQKHSEREPGSIGGGPGRAGGRVVRGMRMAGRTGGDTITVKGLKIVAVDTAQNRLYISGAVPGRRGTMISIVG